MPFSRGSQIAKVGMYVAGFAAVTNISIMYLALPSIERSLHAGIADQQWVLSIYPLMEGGFTLAAGTLGDLYGRRRVLGIGTLIFVFASIACALATNIPALIVLRGIQGIGSAALLALPIAMLLQTLPDGEDNAGTIAVFTTVAGVAAGVAPLIGGALVHWFGWQGIFVFSAALGALVLGAARFAEESVGAGGKRLDFGGQVLSIVGVLALSFALIEGDAGTLASGQLAGAIGIAIGAFALFAIVERYSANPMMRMQYFFRRRFDMSLLILGIVNFAWYGLFLICALFLQSVRHQSEIVAGLCLVPCNAAFFLANAYSSRLTARFGMPAMVATSFGGSMLGMAWLARLPVTAAPWQIAAALCIAGLGWGLICTPGTSIGMTAVRVSDEGFASATLALMRSLFGVFGIAILGALLAAGMAHRITDGLHSLQAPEASTQLVAQAVRHGGVFELVSRPPVGVDAAKLDALIDDSFLHGWKMALLVCFGATFAFGLVISLALRRRDQPAAESPAQ